MTWQLKDKPRTLKATKALAKEFAEMDPAPHDRPLSERRLQVYERLLQQGQFRPVTWARAACAETGGVYRVNGKHTSVLLSGLKEVPDFFVTVEDYACETLEDVARLYATFDSKLQSRTARDINMSFAGTVPELAGLPVNTVSLTVGGVGYALWQEQYWARQPAERAELLLEHAAFALWLQSILSHDRPGPEGERRDSKHLQRMAVVAAMFGTWSKAVGPATQFWTAVRDETGDRPTLPDRKLARFLLHTSTGSPTGRRTVRRADTREFYVKCLHAWNAWRKGEGTNLNYYREARVPGIT